MLPVRGRSSRYPFFRRRQQPGEAAGAGGAPKPDTAPSRAWAASNRSPNVRKGLVFPARDEEGIGPYGWPADITNDAALRELLVRNGDKGTDAIYRGVRSTILQDVVV